MMSRAKPAGQYWDYGLRLVEGCWPVSEGCENCWERAMLKRFGHDPDVVTVHPERLDRLRKGRPGIVAIWSDLFHPKVTDDFIGQTLDAATAGPHQVLILTKRAERMAWWGRHTVWPQNVWLGVTVESEDEVDRLAWLIRAGCPMCWVSVEPILGPVILAVGRDSGWLDWIVVGCETGPGARIGEMTNDRIRHVVEEGEGDAVPVWVKATVGRNGRPTAAVEDRTWIVRDRPYGMRSCGERALVGE